jgi:pyridoxamine 5'-phosphate oxidase
VSLDILSIDPDPYRQFERWFADAKLTRPVEPEAMTLATSTRDGIPSARMVLLKGVDGRGFVFYSNYESRKGRELNENPVAALVFYWAELHRQVRVDGSVERLAHRESDTYFATRPIGSRLSALASRQSEIIPSREDLDRRVRELEGQFDGSEIPRPPFWGGYRLSPTCIEFWQGRPDRLHDRIRYRLEPDGSWIIERLSP